MPSSSTTPEHFNTGSFFKQRSCRGEVCRCLHQLLSCQCSKQRGRNLPPSLLMLQPPDCLQSIPSYYPCLFNNLGVGSPFQLVAFLHTYLFLRPYPSFHCSMQLHLSVVHSIRPINGGSWSCVEAICTDRHTTAKRQLGAC